MTKSIKNLILVARTLTMKMNSYIDETYARLYATLPFCPYSIPQLIYLLMNLDFPSLYF